MRIPLIITVNPDAWTEQSRNEMPAFPNTDVIRDGMGGTRPTGAPWEVQCSVDEADHAPRITTLYDLLGRE